jgi:hypothetical protein
MRGLISPSKIISNNRGEITPEAFSQFMRGEGNGSLGSSIADSANNIVNFSRSTVAPASPNFSSLLGIISTNINNFKSEINQNIQGQVQNITKNIIQRVEGIPQEVQGQVQGISQEVQGQVKEVQGQIQNITKNIIQRVEELTKINLNQNVNNAQFTNNAPQISKEDSVEQNKFIQNQIENITQNNQNELKNIAQNINKTFFNTIQRLQTDSQNILSSTIQKFTTEYREQIKETADNQPSNVLKNFQNLYKSTIDFVTFLGDAKTNNRITKSLVSLRRMFEESLNVSVVIREAIVKIVDQLTNLPSASPSAGGLELGVDVPGGPLKQTGGSLGRTGGRAGLGRRLGLGALGLGIGAAGVGVGAAGAGMLSAKKFQEEKLQSTKAQVQPQEQMIPDDFIRNFQKLIEVFDTSINNLIDFVKSSSGEGGGRTSPGGGGGNPPGTAGPGIGSDSAGENLAAFISTLESTTGLQNQADVMQVMVNRAKGDSDKLFDEVTKRVQFTPASSAIYGATGHDPAADKAYGHIAPLLGNTPEERKAKLREIAAGPNGINNLRELFKAGDAAAAAKVLADFKTGGPLSTRSRADVGGGIYFKGRSQNPGNVYLDRGDPSANKFHDKGSGPAYSLPQNTSPQPSTTPQTPTPQATPKPTDQQSSIAPSSKMGTFPFNTVSNPTSNTNEIAFVNLPQQPLSVFSSNGGSNQSSLKSSGEGAVANSGVYVGKISSKNLFGGFSLITELNLNIFSA